MFCPLVTIVPGQFAVEFGGVHAPAVTGWLAIGDSIGEIVMDYEGTAIATFTSWSFVILLSTSLFSLCIHLTIPSCHLRRIVGLGDCVLGERGLRVPVHSEG